VIHGLDIPQPPTDSIWNSLLNYYLFFGILAGIIVIGWMMYLVVTNRATRRKATPHKKEPKFAEEETGWGSPRNILLTMLLTGSVLAFVEYQTFASTGLLVVPPSSDPITINVVARQFNWTFVYLNGAQVVGNLTVPQGEEILLNITSRDVFHSFSIPELSVARDAIPGHYNALWFIAPSPAVYAVRCKELCGLGHAMMIAKVTVVSSDAYDRWYSTLKPG